MGRAGRSSLGARQTGWARLVGPLLVLALAALPVTWTLPLFRTELFYVFGDEVSVVGVVRALSATDPVLCAVVVAFGILAPVAKITGLIHAWYWLPAERSGRRIALLAKVGKFSMLDVMLVAVAITAIKGVGIGSVVVAPGLYAYGGIVIGVMILSSWMQARADAAARPAAERMQPPPE